MAEYARCREQCCQGISMAKRTTMRSSKGTKLYAVRDKKGRFKDIQTYKRAHTLDMKRKSKSEKAKSK
jgi:hypothetical protein